MLPYLYPTSTSSPLFTLTIILVLATFLPASFCDDDQRYVDCGEQFRCGLYQDIGYPFWGQNRPAHCGHPGFPISCQSDVPLLTINSLSYRILSIDTSSQALTVARDDLWDTNCPESFHNTSLDFSLYNYAFGDQNITLYYGCVTTPTVPPTPHQFDCNATQTGRTNIFARTDVLTIGSFDVALCSNRVIVPVDQTSAQVIESLNASVSDLRAGLTAGFGLQWIADNTLCNDCITSGGRCGYNSSTSSFACYCADQPYAQTCNGRRNKGDTIATVAVVLGIVVFVITPFVCFIWKFKLGGKYMLLWWKKTEKDQNIENFLNNYGSLAPKRYSYSDVKKMTNSFNTKLGQGGYGQVYKGRLCNDNLVAVKILNGSKGNGEDFINEVASISRTSHVNIVNLLGFCIEGHKRALVYEFMPNGSLEKFIYDRSSLEGRQLGWGKLYQIAVGIARGLEYLHRGCNTRILHFDIKPHNILLDENFCPKVADFGLAKLCPEKESILSTVTARGTLGYIAPEVFCRNFGGVSHKSDVYSYGMMVSEMVGGRKNVDVEVAHTSEIYFPHWIFKQLESNNELPLHGIVKEEENEIARKMVIVSLWCIQTDPVTRPSMTKVLEMLEGSLESLQIPPKPYLSSPPRSPAGSQTMVII